MKNKGLKNISVLAMLIFIAVFMPVSKGIAAEVLGPQVAIETISNKLKLKLQDEAFIHDFNQVNAFVDEAMMPHVDFKRISALVLGKLWRKATQEERSQFTKEFKTLLVRSYSRAFVGFKGWAVRFLPLKIKQGAKKIIVKTEILQPGLQPLSINYRMFNTRGVWKMYDILIEGVSLVTNYRTSVKNEYRRSGSIRGVIAKLEKRNFVALAKNDN